MNNQKISFIMCTNDEHYEKECMKYIYSLSVPQNYEIEVLSIKEAYSMTSGYNEGMQFSDAKYKVYLHQDVFIINKNFIYDILELFNDSSVGMIGMVGTVSLPESLVPWEGPRIGSLYSNNILSTKAFEYKSNTTSDFTREVVCIDGLLMATQYDLPWRDDLFKNWDFYDVSQSFEFSKAGYKIIVPEATTPWVIHDDGILNLSNYESEKEFFRKEYL